MHALAQRLFFLFGLRRNTAARRTPTSLQVERSNVVRLRADHRGPQRPCAARIGVRVDGDGLAHVHVHASAPRTA